MRFLIRAAPLLLAARVVLAQDSAAARVDPWKDRPVCASAFLEADWELVGKQRVCDWLHNGVLSVGGLAGAGVGAATSMMTKQTSERGDPYLERFGRRAAQNAFKATALFAVGWAAGEDPRRRPPYLALVGPRPTGFLRRAGLALRENLFAYQCDSDCTQASHVDPNISVARIAGAAASGFGGELLLRDGRYSVSRAASASLSAYALSYANALAGEFTPEVTAGIAKAIGKIFRGD